MYKLDHVGKREYLERNLLREDDIQILYNLLNQNISFYFIDAKYGYCFANQYTLFYCSADRDLDREDLLVEKKIDVEPQCFTCLQYSDYKKHKLPGNLERTCIGDVRRNYQAFENGNLSMIQSQRQYEIKPIRSKLVDINVYRIKQDMYTRLYKNIDERHYSDQLENGPFIYSFLSDVGLEFIFDNGRSIALWRDVISFFSSVDEYFYDSIGMNGKSVLSCCFQKMKRLAWKYNQITYEDFVQDKDLEEERQMYPNAPKDFCPFIGNIQLISIKSITDPLYL